MQVEIVFHSDLKLSFIHAFHMYAAGCVQPSKRQKHVLFRLISKSFIENSGPWNPVLVVFFIISLTLALNERVSDINDELFSKLRSTEAQKVVLSLFF